jgi:hypothetical protein
MITLSSLPGGLRFLSTKRHKPLGCDKLCPARGAQLSLRGTVWNASQHRSNPAASDPGATQTPTHEDPAPMTLHHPLCRLILLAAVASGWHSLQAQESRPGKGKVYTEPPKDDPSYQLQGEFVGPVAIGENEYKPLGLQVRPVGGDNFEAVSFMGGLPGEKNHRPEPVKMIGRRSGDFVVLSGGPWAIFAEKDRCLIVDRKGNKVGQLDRIERSSSTLGARPPQGAAVIFDGTNIDQFTNAQMTKEGLLMAGADLKPMFQDFDLHLEFRLPYMPSAEGQSRGNSGVYLQSRYECQVLDSFAQDRMINGSGALYRFRKPDVNMCLPPLVWQTYDIRFTAPRWAADGSKLRDAHVTSWINGVKVQDDVALPNKTGAGKPEEPLLLPTRLQDHGDPVRYRNVWLIDRGLTPGIKFPVHPAEKEPAEKVDSKKKVSDPAEPKQQAKQRPKPEAKKNQEAKKAADAKDQPKGKGTEKPQPVAEDTPAQDGPAAKKPAADKPAEEKSDAQR